MCVSCDLDNSRILHQLNYTCLLAAFMFKFLHMLHQIPSTLALHLVSVYEYYSITRYRARLWTIWYLYSIWSLSMSQTSMNRFYLLCIFVCPECSTIRLDWYTSICVCCLCYVGEGLSNTKKGTVVSKPKKEKKKTFFATSHRTKHKCDDQQATPTQSSSSRPPLLSSPLSPLLPVNDPTQSPRDKNSDMVCIFCLFVLLL